MAKENTVSIQINPQDLNKVISLLGEVQTILKPYLIALTPEERKELPKMSDKTTPFVEKALEYAKSNPEFAPAYLNINELSIDVKAVNDLTSIVRPVEMLNENLNDTILLSGSEAYSAALTFYNSVKQAAKMNVPNAKSIYEDLKKRFEGQGRKKENGKTE
ncbi:MAG: hypothetical protein OHK0038_17620 [Flammeovirgaceae bacterium]